MVSMVDQMADQNATEIYQAQAETSSLALFWQDL